MSTAERLLPDMSPENLDRNADLAERIHRLDITDVVRVFSIAGHEMLDRSANPITADELVAELISGVADAHRLGMP